MFVAKGERSDEDITFHYIAEAKRTPCRAAFAVMINISFLINISVWYTTGTLQLWASRSITQLRAFHRYSLASFASKRTEERDSDMSLTEAERRCYFSVPSAYSARYVTLKFRSNESTSSFFQRVFGLLVSICERSSAKPRFSERDHRCIFPAVYRPSTYEKA